MEQLVSVFLVLTKTGVAITVIGIIGLVVPQPGRHIASIVVVAGGTLLGTSLLLAIVFQAISLLLPALS